MTGKPLVGAVRAPLELLDQLTPDAIDRVHIGQQYLTGGNTSPAREPRDRGRCDRRPARTACAVSVRTAARETVTSPVGVVTTSTVAETGDVRIHARVITFGAQPDGRVVRDRAATKTVAERRPVLRNDVGRTIASEATLSVDALGLWLDATVAATAIPKRFTLVTCWTPMRETHLGDALTVDELRLRSVDVIPVRGGLLGRLTR